MSKNAAYHEAGHVVMSYFVGYKVKQSIIYLNGDGETRVDYGKDISQIKVAMTLDETCQAIDTVDVSEDVSLKIVRILIAGSVAESISKYGRNYVGGVEVELIGPDLTKSINICKLKNFSIDELVSEIYEVMKYDEIWDAIEKIVSGFLSRKKDVLTNSEIELILDNSKFRELL
jgi:hypothetical protein